MVLVHSAATESHVHWKRLRITSPRPFGESTTGVGTGGAAAAGAATGTVAADRAPESATGAGRRCGGGCRQTGGVGGARHCCSFEVLRPTARSASSARGHAVLTCAPGCRARPGLGSVAESFRMLLQPYRSPDALSRPLVCATGGVARSVDAPAPSDAL